MPKINQSGVPSIIANQSGASNEVLAASLVTPQPLTSSLSSLLGSFLSIFITAAVVVIDPIRKRISGSGDAVTGAALKTAATLDTPGNPTGTGTITPDAGQTGRSLTYTASLAGIDQEYVDAVASIIASQKPKLTIETLAAKIATFDYPTKPAPLIVVDQVAGTITLTEVIDRVAMEGVIDSVVGMDTNGLTMEITTEPETPADSPLVFEGGAV